VEDEGVELVHGEENNILVEEVDELRNLPKEDHIVEPVHKSFDVAVHVSADLNLQSQAVLLSVMASRRYTYCRPMD
jgi:hypothetical protein